MIEAESKIESRVAVPGTFRVKEHRPLPPMEDVLRAHVAMDEGTLRRERRVAEAIQEVGKIGMTSCRRP
jgi:hypothetical protein